MLLLLRNKLSPSVTKVEQLIDSIGRLNQMKKEVPQGVLFDGLGIKNDWLQR
ncbi:MAG TPA: hypothetical protein VHK67_06035 [Rhabdochlamydiaceae bacterium]|nr:hypothetical protein [Rhabdochlamydiaceae bacterium]